MLEFNILITSFFNAKKYQLDNKFSVACWKPDWCLYKDLDFLFPRDINGIRIRLHNSNNSVDEFIEALREGYSDRWSLIESWLENLDKRKQYILCCWCPSSSSSKEQLKKTNMFFCHATLIGKMIKIHRPDLIVKLDVSRETQSIPSTIDWYKIQVEKIISGGQIGADEAGLIAATSLGLKTGGMMPLGFRTLDGDKPEFKAKYSMEQHSSYYYVPRIYENVKRSDGTVRFATKFNSSGEKCTLEAIIQYDKPYFDVDVFKDLELQKVSFRSWLKCNTIKVLNVAGNSEKTSPGISQKIISFLKDCLSDK